MSGVLTQRGKVSLRNPDLVPVPERIKIILAMLTKAAADNRPCPDNNTLAVAVGAQSGTAGSNAIALLETMGVITVVRGQMERIVTIVATGTKTAGTIKRPIHRASGTKKSLPRPPFWTPTRDAALMQRIADGADFEQAAVVCGCTGDIAAARFDELAAAMGRQAV